MDSYEKFFEHFKIDKKDFFQWGISATVFPPYDKVKEKWYDLKERITNNGTVYIRGYGRDAVGTKLYIGLYKKMFGNDNIKKDPSNNSAPQNMLQCVTGQKRNKDIYNYQVSHIWGHTKNIFMFEAPWNICYTPKIMDPFTGHEAMGELPDEYKKLFIEKATALYRPFVEDYNTSITKYDVTSMLDEYISSLNIGKDEEKNIQRFRQDAIAELSVIELP